MTRPLRWFRFRLRTLLVAVTVLSIWFAVSASPWSTLANVSDALTQGDLERANRYCDRSRVEFSALRSDGSFTMTVINPRNRRPFSQSYTVAQFAAKFQGSRRSLGELLAGRLSTASGSVLFGHLQVTSTRLSFEPETY